jgi:hypothetical protein
MKWIVSILALSLSSLALAQDVTVIQINAKWNKSNTVDSLRNLRGCEYVFGWLENQPYQIQNTISSVPVVVVYKDNVARRQYTAGITLKLSATFEEIQTLVNSLKEE